MSEDRAIVSQEPEMLHKKLRDGLGAYRHGHVSYGYVEKEIEIAIRTAVEAAILKEREDKRELLLRAACLLSERAPCAEPSCRVTDGQGAVMRCYDELLAAARASK